MEKAIQPAFEKYSDGLMPCIVQDDANGTVLMLGFVNQEALERSIETGLVTFYSRSKQRLWTKGESSGNRLQLKNILLDCDQDTLLMKAIPTGPVCHTGASTCFGESNEPRNFLYQLERIVENRLSNPNNNSYTSSLFDKGINKIAQKVGEEAVELVIEAMDDNIDRFKEEAADLLFHLLVLLRSKNISLSEVEALLRSRHRGA